MSIWNQTIKRIILGLAAVTVAISWTQSGAAASPCIVGRGLDPLDVVNSGVRHNVWIILDSSGSMNDPFTGGTGVSKIDVARDVIKNLMTTLVDGAGRPLVNWAFVNYSNVRDGFGKCGRPDASDDLDEYSDQPDGCVGLRDSSFVPPSLCGDDSREDITTVLDGIGAGGITPIGVAFTDAAEYLVGQHRPDDATPASTVDYVAGLLPDQRNYIIHVTDGRDTCECEAGGYPPVFSDPLEDPVDMRPSTTDPNFVETVAAPDDDIASYNAGLKGEVALRTIDPALDGSKGNIFVIGMDLGPADKRRINTIAWMASGARIRTDRALMNPAFFADEEDALVTAFEDILARVGIPSSRLSLGASQVASVKEVIASHTNPTIDPLDVMPPGASATELQQARQIRSDHENNVLFSTSVEVPGFRGHLTATNIYRVEDPDGGGPLEPDARSDRVADFTELWDAGVELQDDDPDARPMFFNKRGSTAVLPFNSSNVDPEDVGVAAGYLSEVDGTGARTDEHARDIIVNVTRGYRLSLHPVTGTLYRPDDELNFTTTNEDGTPTWKLYENVTGAVAVVSNPPRSPDFDPPLVHSSEYGSGIGSGFYWDHLNRRTIVYYPSNFGILHGFDAQFGTEVVAFIADDSMSLAPGEIVGSRDTLKDVVALVVKENNGVVNHKFLLAGPPTAQDAFLRDNYGGDNNWHSLVVYGRGRGGRFLTALDVTTVPTNPSTLRLLWNRGNREGLTEGAIDGLGESWSTPVLGNVRLAGAPSTDDSDADQWLVFAGGGYGCENSEDEGQYIFAFRAEDGFLYANRKITNSTTAAIPYNAVPARVTLFNPHEEDVADFKDWVTRVYFPDIQGNVWKLDTSDPDPANWTIGVFAELGEDHPITAPVTVLNDTFDDRRVFVMAGSGGDRRAPAPAGGFKLRTWIDADPDGTNTFQWSAGTDPGSIPLEQLFMGEQRMFEQPITVGTIGDPLPPVVFFVASQENFDTVACVVSFNSTLYAAGIESGIPEFDLDSTQPEDVSTDLGEGKAFLFSRDANVYVTRSGGLGASADVSVWGDGEFDDEPPSSGFGGFVVAVRVEGFRISPF